MTPQKFKERWESTNSGGGITYDDVAKHAKLWGLFATPRIHQMSDVLFAVLKRADTVDAEEFRPEDEA